MQDDSHTAGPDAQGDVPPALVDDIAGRLRAVCGHLQPDEFAALVAEIAQTKIRFAQRAASLSGLSGLWEPPRAEILEGLRLHASADPPPEATSAG